MDEVTAAPFTWSYSRLTNFETCPRRYFETQVKRAWPEDESPQLAWGNDVHAALAEALRSNTPLAPQYQVFEHWLEKIRRTPGEMLVEEQCRWAITREFKPTPWMSKAVWLRAIADVIKIDDDVALVVDWKAGKSANVDMVQNQLVSLIVLIYFPKIEIVRSDFIWLQEDDSTIQTVYRSEMADYWAQILPRVKELEKATAAKNFPPVPNRYCRSWCPVESCEYWGK